jgi:hypothetical protein
MTMPDPATPAYSPATATTSAPARKKNPLGLVALILGAATVLIGTALTLVQAGVVGSRNFELLGAFSALQSVASGLLGIGATIVGIIALILPNTSKPLAAAGLALGVSSVLGTITGLLYGVISSISASF